MDQGLLELARYGARTATKAGATHARTKATRSREVRVEWRDGRLDRIRESTKQGFSIALFVAGRYSESASSDLRRGALERYIQEAVAAARHLAPDPHRRLPDPSRYAGVSGADLEIADPAIGAISADARLAEARELEETARTGKGSDRIVSVTASVSDYEVETVCHATNGLDAGQRGTHFARSVSVSVADGDGRKPQGSSYASSRYASDLAPTAELGADALRRALGQLGSRQIPTGRYEVIIENRVVPTLGWHILAPLHGSAVQQKRSFYGDRLNTRIGSALVSLTDDPHLPRGLATAAFDGEGMATTRRTVIDEGVLKTFFLDTYYASKLRVPPTTGRPSNLVWRTGARDADGMVSGLAEGLLVTSFLGGNSNTTTGDFSFGIKGFYVKNGAIVHPVSEMNIAGNHLRFLGRLVETGSDPWTSSSDRSPSLRFTDVQCSGA